jgi:mRNA interferase HigB
VVLTGDVETEKTGPSGRFFYGRDLGQRLQTLKISVFVQDPGFVNVFLVLIKDFLHDIRDCNSPKLRPTSPKTGGHAVRVIAKGTLREFWESRPAYADSETPLVEWYRHMEKAVYGTPQEVKAELRTASILKGGRVVFNIGGNKYRVIMAID